MMRGRARPVKAAGVWMRNHLEALPLVLLAVIAGGVFAFVEIADEVVEGETHVFDKAVLLALRDPQDAANPIGPAWLEATMRDVTSLGSTFTLTFVTLAVAAWLAMAGRRSTSLLVLASVGGGTVLSNLLKFLFDRPRPDLVAHGVEVFTASFPSGHAMLSAVTYLTLGALVARVSARRRLKVYVLFLAVLLTLLIGASRIYLGVHWPTDVLAGWAIGAAWATLVWTVALWLQRRGNIAADER